ncbi:hypothetical protein Pelo_14437 [Pelomyxa schiedti]|nr:hypothetical protein Pelo_14437 [Pelomyxa schiedti]
MKALSNLLHKAIGSSSSDDKRALMTTSSSDDSAPPPYTELPLPAEMREEKVKKKEPTEAATPSIVSTTPPHSTTPCTSTSTTAVAPATPTKTAASTPSAPITPSPPSTASAATPPPLLIDFTPTVTPQQTPTVLIAPKTEPTTTSTTIEPATRPLQATTPEAAAPQKPVPPETPISAVTIPPPPQHPAAIVSSTLPPSSMPTPSTPTAKPVEKTSPVKVDDPKVELVDCPMCFQQFLPSKIEQHAANCTGGEPPAKETAPKSTEIKAPPLSPTVTTPATPVNITPVVSTPTPLETLKPTPAPVPTPTPTPIAPVQHPDAKRVQLMPIQSNSSPTDSKTTVAPSTSPPKNDSSWGDILKKQEEMLKSLMAMVPPSTLSALAASSSSIKSPESIGINNTAEELQPLIKQQTGDGDDATPMVTTIPLSPPKPSAPTTPTAPKPVEKTSPVKAEAPKVELVDCPMCFQQFLPSKIEQHAANCTGGEPPAKETAPKPTELKVPPALSPAPKTEICPVCAQEVPSTQIVEHVEMCLIANEAPSDAPTTKPASKVPPSQALAPTPSTPTKTTSATSETKQPEPTTSPAASSSSGSSASIPTPVPTPASSTAASTSTSTSATTSTTTTTTTETSRHENDEDDEELYEDCPSCGKPISIAEIFDHVKTCKPRKKSTVETCPLCFLTFPASEMEDHLAECVGSAPKAKKDLVTTCPLCSKLFPVSKMEAHVKDCLLVKKTRPKTPPSSSPATAAATSAATAAAAAASAAALQQLQEMLPFIDDEGAKEALSQSNGNVEAAVAIILGTQGSSDDMFEEPTEVSSVIPPDTPANLRKLMFIFPHTDLITLKTTLESANGDVNRAVAYLMGGDIWDLYVDEIPEGLGIAPLPSGNDIAPGEPIKKNGVIIRINKKAPCQSFNAMNGDPVDLISSCLPGDSAQFCAYCFCTMIQREQKHFGDFYVFYHSYSLASILYELQSEIASVIYGMSSDFPPLPRLLHAPFRGKKNLSVLQSELHGSDHNVSFRALAIAASNGLFATSSEMHPISCFMQGYSCGDVEWGKLLKDVLTAVGFTGREVDDAAKKVIDIGAKYYIPTSHFGAGTQAYSAPSTAHPPGNMLQIFIHKEILDDVAYPCQPYGHPIQHSGTFAEYLKSNPTGQTRIFAFPALFVDRNHAFIYHYCANQDLCCPDSKVPGSRGALKRELRAVLKPVLGTSEGRRAAFQRIQAHE